jgi:hypothetical protein
MEKFNQHNIPDADSFWPDVEKTVDDFYKKRNRKYLLVFFAASLFIFSTIFTFQYFQESQIKNSTSVNNKSNDTIDKPNTKKPVQTTNNNKNVINSTEDKIPQKENSTRSLERDKKSDFLKSSNKVVLDSINNYEYVNTNTQKQKTESKSSASLKSKDSLLSNRLFSGDRLKKYPPVLFAGYNSINLNYSLYYNSFDYKTDVDYVLKNKFYFGASFSYDYVSKKLQENGISNELINKRRAEENPIFLSKFGFILGKRINGFIIEAGLSLNRFGEDINYGKKTQQLQIVDNSKWLVNYTNYQKVDTFYNFGVKNYTTINLINKDSVFASKIDSTFVLKDDSLALKLNRRTQTNYIEIPFFLGYEFKLNKFSVAPMLGFSLGCFLNSNANFINSSETNIADNNRTNYHSKVLLNYQAQLRFGYDINNYFSVFVAPNYRGNATSQSNSSSGVKTFYNDAGGMVGLIYKR